MKSKNTVILVLLVVIGILIYFQFNSSTSANLPQIPYNKKRDSIQKEIVYLDKVVYKDKIQVVEDKKQIDTLKLQISYLELKLAEAKINSDTTEIIQVQDSIIQEQKTTIEWQDNLIDKMDTIVLNQAHIIDLKDSLISDIQIELDSVSTELIRVKKHRKRLIISNITTLVLGIIK